MEGIYDALAMEDYDNEALDLREDDKGQAARSLGRTTIPVVRLHNKVVYNGMKMLAV